MDTHENEISSCQLASDLEKLSSAIDDLKCCLNQVFETLHTIIQTEKTRHVNVAQKETNSTPKWMVDKETQLFARYISSVRRTKEMCSERSSCQQSSMSNLDSFCNAARDCKTQIEGIVGQLGEYLQAKTDAEKKLSKENATQRNEMRRLEEEANNHRQNQQEALAAKNTALAMCRKLQEQVEEKSQEIHRLHREGTVSLWKREKQKITVGLRSREQDLETRMQSQRDEFEETKSRLQHRISELQNQLKLKKMERARLQSPNEASDKSTLRYAVPPGAKELDDVKRQLFITERMLTFASAELKKQQEYFAGILAGVARDFQIMLARASIDQPNYNQDQKDYCFRLKVITEAVSNGSVSKVRSELPAYYLGADLKLAHPVVDRISTATQSKHTKRFEYNREILQSLSDHHVDSSLLTWREGPKPHPVALFSTIQNERPNPVLVNEKGQLLLDEAKTYFTEIKSEKLKSLFETFQTIDANGDGVLDAPEILHSIPGLLGKMSTIGEVSEALNEVDLDKSATIDFFEFLLMFQKLQKGELKSRIFQRRSLSSAKMEMKSRISLCLVQ